MKNPLAASLMLLAACGAPPDKPTVPPAAEIALPDGLEVRDAWASATPGGVDVSAGYLTIANGAAPDRLVSASSPRAARIEIHEMSMDGNIMRMRQIEDGLEVPASGAVTLSPGGLHLMFIGVSQPFALGEEIPVTLTFENAGVREVRLPVRAGGGH